MGWQGPMSFLQVADALGERRAYPRFKVALNGICSIANGNDRACAVLDLSLGGAQVVCSAPAKVGDDASLLLPHIGLVGARVTRASADGLGVAFTGGVRQRRRVQDYLVFVLRSQEDDTVDARTHRRIVPLRRTVEVRRAGAGSHMARIRDVSRSGVALTTTVEMTIGEDIVIGATAAEVVRVFKGGGAARFATPLAPTFDASVTL